MNIPNKADLATTPESYIVSSGLAIPEWARDWCGFTLSDGNFVSYSLKVHERKERIKFTFFKTDSKSPAIKECRA